MAYIKKQHETALIIEGGRLLGEILENISKKAAPGITTAEIDALAEEQIYAVGGRPAFKGYQTGGAPAPFPSTICASINEEIVHGIATENKILANGDLFSIDIGMEWPIRGLKESQKNSYSQQGGYFTDTALTVGVGQIVKADRLLLERTKEAMLRGIAVTTPGNSVAHIGRVVEDFISPFGYGIVEELCGHGVGHEIHEDPNVLFFYDKRLEKWKLEPGVVICIEPMITTGTKHVEVASDGWSIITADNKKAAHFEHTVVVTKNGPVRATKRPSEPLLDSEK